MKPDRRPNRRTERERDSQAHRRRQTDGQTDRQIIVVTVAVMYHFQRVSSSALAFLPLDFLGDALSSSAYSTDIYRHRNTQTQADTQTQAYTDTLIVQFCLQHRHIQT